MGIGQSAWGMGIRKAEVRMRKMSKGAGHQQYCIVQRVLGTGLWLLVAGFWFLVAGFWSLVSGYWFLVAGFWLLVAGPGYSLFRI